MCEVENPARELWQHQPVEGIQMSVEELRRRAGKFERRIYWRNVREYVASLFVVGLLACFFATTEDGLSRVSFGLFIAAMLWIVVQLHLKGSSKKVAQRRGYRDRAAVLSRPVGAAAGGADECVVAVSGTAGPRGSWSTPSDTP